MIAPLVDRPITPEEQENYANRATTEVMDLLVTHDTDIAQALSQKTN